MNPGEAVSIRRPFARSADRRRALARTFTTASAAAPVLAIGIVALVVRIAFGPQLDGLDDAGYLNAAQRVALGHPLDTLFALFRTRVGMAYPLGWLIGAGWLAPAQFWILTLLADAVVIASLLAAGRLLTGKASAGLCAAALYAVYPLAIQQSALYYPTAFQAASIAAAFALIGLAERLHSRARMLAGLGAGLSIGVGYLFKEDVAIVVPAIALASVLARFPRIATTAAVCAGAAAVFAVECAAYWYTAGSPLFRLTATSGLGAPMDASLQIADIWRWDAYLRSRFLIPVAVGATWWCVIPAMVSVWRRRHAGMVFIMASFVIVMVYLQFGSGSLSSFSPLPKTPRYTALATPLLMLLVGAWLAELLGTRRRIAAAVIAALVIAAIPCVFFLNVSSSERARNTLAAVPVVDAMPAAPLYSDYYTVRILRLLQPARDIRVWYHADFVANTIVVQSAPEPGSLVLFDRQAAKVYTSSYAMDLPLSIRVPPETWQSLWTHRAYADGSMARVLLEGIRRAAARLPSGNPLSSRVERNISDMIEGDRATLYRVP